VAAAARADLNRHGQRHELVRRGDRQTGGHRAGRLVVDRYLLPVHAEDGRGPWCDADGARAGQTGEEAAAAHHGGRQAVAGVVEQQRARVAEEVALHRLGIGQPKRADQVAGPGVDVDHRQREASRVAPVAVGQRREDHQPVRVGLPPQPLGIGALLQAERPIDPGLRAVGERRPVVRLAPDQEATRGGLQRIATLRVAVLVFDAVAHDLRDQVMQGLKAQHERARWRLSRGQACGKQNNDEERGQGQHEGPPRSGTSGSAAATN
jgi:hypothetical protein